jgi:hypothetical protein
MADGMPDGWSENSYFRYQREHLTLRLTLRSLNNHEIREILVGLWSRLDRDDQIDHINELQHYLESGSRLSGLAAEIRDAPGLANPKAS